MGRSPKFERADMTVAALRLVAAEGPAALTLAALSREIGAPTGSIYHRFASREALLAELWLDVVEAFQQVLVAALDGAGDVDGACSVVAQMSAWVRAHPAEARVLLLHHRRDFVPAEMPPALVSRAAALEPQVDRALRSFARRAFGHADAPTLTRLRFALLDAPLGAIKPYLQAQKPAPPLLDQLLETTVRAALAPLLAP